MVFVPAHQATQQGGIGPLGSILGLHKSLKIRAPISRRISMEFRIESVHFMKTDSHVGFCELFILWIFPSCSEKYTLSALGAVNYIFYIIL
jgi:hypothetical protein